MPRNFPTAIFQSLLIGATYGIAAHNLGDVTTVGYDGAALSWDLRAPGGPVTRWDDLDDYPLFSVDADRQAGGGSGWCVVTGTGRHSVVRVYDRRGGAGAAVQPALRSSGWTKAPLLYSVFTDRKLDSPVYSVSKAMTGMTVALSGEVKVVDFWPRESGADKRLDDHVMIF